MYPRRSVWSEVVRRVKLYAVSKPYYRKDRKRWAVGWRDPETDRRRQSLFGREADAWSFYNQARADREAVRAGTLTLEQVKVGAKGLTEIGAVIEAYHRHMTRRGLSAAHIRESKRFVRALCTDRQIKCPKQLHGQEIEDLCLNYLETELPDWSRQRVMVVGAGVVGMSIVRQLTAQGRRVTWCYHCNKPGIPKDCERLVELCTMNAVKDRVAIVDVIICATSSEGHVLHMGHAPFFDQERSTVIVDLAMPRNVAPDLNGIADSIRVVDLDDLKHWYRRKMADMARIFELSKEVVEQHADMYEKLIVSFQDGAGRTGTTIS